MFVRVERCDNAGENGITRLASVRCPTGLAFDIERQTCDWRANVKNCDRIESKSIILQYRRHSSLKSTFI